MLDLRRRKCSELYQLPVSPGAIRESSMRGWRLSGGTPGTKGWVQAVLIPGGTRFRQDPWNSDSVGVVCSVPFFQVLTSKMISE